MKTEGLFKDRTIAYEPVELTSRVSTDKVSEAKRRLEQTFQRRKDHVDVAIATNMISVGLDITRLGLMVVLRAAEDQLRVHPGHQPCRS